MTLAYQAPEHLDDFTFSLVDVLKSYVLVAMYPASLQRIQNLDRDIPATGRAR